MAADTADWPSLIETKEQPPRKKRPSEAGNGTSSSSPPSSEKDGAPNNAGGGTGGATGGGAPNKKGGRKMSLAALPDSLAPTQGGRANGDGRSSARQFDRNSNASGRSGRGGASNNNNRRSQEALATNSSRDGDASSAPGPRGGSGRGGRGGRGGFGGRGAGAGAAAAYTASGSVAATASAAAVAAATTPYAYGYMNNSIFYNPAAFSMAGAPAKAQVMEALRMQIEYYFSVDNLCRDIFLRSKMDNDGYIPVAVIANFNRVRMLTPDLALIQEALRDSAVVRFNADNTLLRCKDNPLQWVPPPLSSNGSAPSPSPSPRAVAGTSTPTNVQASPTAPPPPAAESSAAPVTPVREEAAKEEQEDDLFELDEVRAARTGCSSSSGAWARVWLGAKWPEAITMPCLYNCLNCGLKSELQVGGCIFGDICATYLGLIRCPIAEGSASLLWLLSVAHIFIVTPLSLCRSKRRVVRRLSPAARGCASLRTRTSRS